MSNRRAARATAASGGRGSPRRGATPRAGRRAPRGRRLWLTERGVKLERELTDRQSQRFARAYRETGADAVEGFRKVLLGLPAPAERAVVDKRLRGGGR